MAVVQKEPDLFHYILIIKKEKPVNIDFISILLCLISFIFFVYYSFVHQSFATALFWGSLLVPVALTRTVWLKRKFTSKATFKHPLLLTAIVWLFVPGMRWIFILFVLFVLFDQQARQQLEIGVSTQQIVINTFFRKKYQWNEFSNIVLKDNLLTLDFKNNTILQKEIEPNATDINEQIFNAFCMEQMKKNDSVSII